MKLGSGNDQSYLNLTLPTFQANTSQKLFFEYLEHLVSGGIVLSVKMNVSHNNTMERILLA